MAFGLILAAILFLFSVMTIRAQFRLLDELRRTPTMPEEDRAYLRKRARRRVINSGLMFVLGGLLAWTFLSGNEARAEEIGERFHQAQLAAKQDPTLPPAVLSPEEKEFRVFWASYWIVFLLILFAVFTLAITDFWATRRYAVKEMKRIRDDQKILLERDLALYKQSKRDRIKRGEKS